MSVIEIKASNAERTFEESTAAVRALTDLGIDCFGSQSRDGSACAAIVVEDKSTWVAICVLKDAGFAVLGSGLPDLRDDRSESTPRADRS